MAACNRCGEKKLHWKKNSEGHWWLVESNGTWHSCGTDSAVGASSKSTPEEEKLRVEVAVLETKINNLRKVFQAELCETCKDKVRFRMRGSNNEKDATKQ